MKKILITAAVAGLFAAPAFADDYRAHDPMYKAKADYYNDRAYGYNDPSLLLGPRDKNHYHVSGDVAVGPADNYIYATVQHMNDRDYFHGIGRY